MVSMVLKCSKPIKQLGKMLGIETSKRQKSNSFNGIGSNSGGGNEPGDQLSPVQVSTAQDRFEILRVVEGQNSRPQTTGLNDRSAGPYRFRCRTASSSSSTACSAAASLMATIRSSRPAMAKNVASTSSEWRASAIR